MTLYGFFHSSCIYESAHGLVSLHQSKAGAYRAMVAAQRHEWERERELCGAREYRGMRRSVHFDYRESRQFEDFKVMPVEVLP